MELSQSTDFSAAPETLESMTNPKIPKAPPVPHLGSPLNRVTLGPGLRTFDSRLYDLLFRLTRRNMLWSGMVSKEGKINVRSWST